ncbi:MAG TPA: hypothetical protein PLM79_09570 [Syntrophobacteraceae bacterium]|nr:hypothetical protein [Syntrophobacteraceae bacterium]
MMARIIYCHPAFTKYDFHVFTDLDFWDSRRILKDVAWVKRNFGGLTCGDEFPTQVVLAVHDRLRIRSILRRLRKAVVSPPRHVIVRFMVFHGVFEFDPRKYYPLHWSADQMIRFTFMRLPLHQGALCNPYQTVRLSWAGSNIRVERVQRELRVDSVVRTQGDARRALHVPSCF